VRIYFGIGGPNFISSFHVIGTIFDRVFNAASLVSAPLASVQTVTVPPGGATVVDLSLPVPGRYVLVDHALTRMERGLVGALIVDGPDAGPHRHGRPPPSWPAPTVMAGLVPATHVFCCIRKEKAWMAGPNPAMTMEGVAP
jgi:hypothetical protein